MASHFKWYPGSEEVVVPWNAQYQFPSQANKSMKLTPRIPPKNGSTFTPGQVIRLEFPAQGYVNPLNTTLQFDVTLNSFGTIGNDIVRFQNNIQSLFNRVRLLYGATPIEDVINYNVIVRCLTEWSGTGQNGIIDQMSIGDGVGGVTLGSACSYTGSAVSTTAPTFGNVNVRQAYIQGVDASTNTSTTATTKVNSFASGYGFGTVPNQEPIVGTTTTAGTYTGSQGSGTNGFCTRRYQVNFALGMFTQDKLIPTKFMASQLAIEITLESADACIFVQQGTGSGATPTYAVGNVNLIPEIIEFDASYDAMFLRGLREGGVPIKFSSWHTFQFSTNNSSNVNLLVAERSRSVKALFAVQRRSPVDRRTDSHATFFDTSSYNSAGNSMQTYQWRIGGRYFPAAPVQLSTTIGSYVSNGGAEAFIELQKALNIVGDYRLSTATNTLKWAVPPATANITIGAGGLATSLPELDYDTVVTQYSSKGHPTYAAVTSPAGSTDGNAFAGNVGSACYVSAISLETSNGLEISGLNAEEQSDIAFLGNWARPQAATFVLEVYSYYDAMIILRENNVLELIQ